MQQYEQPLSTTTDHCGLKYRQASTGSVLRALEKTTSLLGNHERDGISLALTVAIYKTAFPMM
ncbi:MAG: hypothetical protein HY287_09455 [Planctomycetes bacterium]|nr:hypothetical protein [Planctomycetota bacterium]MBI3834538.1 hypothetical protein [Planctomycetota bacterium]